MIVMGFIEPFAKELPMGTVDLNQLIKLEMKNSIRLGIKRSKRKSLLLYYLN
ncbi:MAG: hypothetical protein ACLU5J_10480 [Christensenellales bacterium]